MTGSTLGPHCTLMRVRYVIIYCDIVESDVILTVSSKVTINVVYSNSHPSISWQKFSRTRSSVSLTSVPNRPSVDSLLDQAVHTRLACVFFQSMPQVSRGGTMSPSGRAPHRRLRLAQAAAPEPGYRMKYGVVGKTVFGFRSSSRGSTRCSRTRSALACSGERA